MNLRVQKISNLQFLCIVLDILNKQKVLKTKKTLKTESITGNKGKKRKI